MKNMKYERIKLKAWGAIMAFIALAFMVSLPALIMAAGVLQGFGITIGSALAVVIVAYAAVVLFGDSAADVIASIAAKNRAEEKVDKLGKAVGVKWQIIPERRRWVSLQTADPAQEEEQPQILSLHQH